MDNKKKVKVFQEIKASCEKWNAELVEAGFTDLLAPMHIVSKVLDQFPYRESREGIILYLFALGKSADLPEPDLL